jgi:hypothetical protein
MMTRFREVFRKDRAGLVVAGLVVMEIMMAMGGLVMMRRLREILAEHARFMVVSRLMVARFMVVRRLGEILLEDRARFMVTGSVVRRLMMRGFEVMSGFSKELLEELAWVMSSRLEMGVSRRRLSKVRGEVRRHVLRVATAFGLEMKSFENEIHSLPEAVDLRFGLLGQMLQLVFELSLHLAVQQGQGIGEVLINNSADNRMREAVWALQGSNSVVVEIVVDVALHGQSDVMQIIVCTDVAVRRVTESNSLATSQLILESLNTLLQSLNAASVGSSGRVRRHFSKRSVQSLEGFQRARKLLVLALNECSDSQTILMGLQKCWKISIWVVGSDILTSCCINSTLGKGKQHQGCKDPYPCHIQ